MSYIDHKYINLLAVRLRNFRRKSQNLYNFSCPLCLDSKTRANRARGYFFERDTTFIFHCHNCGVSMRFDTFLKQLDYRLYADYKMELSNLLPKTEDDYVNWKTEKPKFISSDAQNELWRLKTISQLPTNHPAKLYIQQRRIPNAYHARFRWCPKFKAFTNELVPGKFKEPIENEEGRIIIPYLTKENKLFAYNGRAVHASDLRYIIIILDHTTPRVFGLNTVDPKKNMYVFEGEMDATFIENSLAIGGQHISELTSIAPLDRFIIIFDNEPHSIHTRKKIIQTIKLGFRVAIWPNDIREKDVNEMIQNGYTPDHLKQIIDTNTFSGMSAQTRLMQWTKVG